MIINSFVIVSLGAVLGVWLRYFFLTHWLPGLSKRYWLTALLNIIASFLLGFLFAMNSFLGDFRSADRLMYFLGIGFLGSLSTFSTFVYELYYLLRVQYWADAFAFLSWSICGSLLAITAGYFLAHV